VEILVIVLGGPELSSRHDRCDDIFLNGFVFASTFWEASGEAFLLAV